MAIGSIQRTTNTKHLNGNINLKLNIIKHLLAILAIVSFALCCKAQNEAESTSSDSTSKQSTVTMLGTYYADKFVGRRTSNGEIFRQNQYTAAHRNYPFGTYLLVQHPQNGLSIVVKVNDRCPKSNVLDMTKIAVHSLGIRGSAKVSVTILDPIIGKQLWVNQDTTWMAKEEYLAFRDRSSTRKISPYPLGNGSDSKSPARPTPSTKTPTKQITNNKELIAEPSTVSDPIPDSSNSQADTATSVVKPQGPLYDIELCTVISQNVANLEVGRLPLDLRDKIVFELNRQNREVKIILEIANTRSHAVRTQARLIELFPDSCLIPHVQN